MSDALDGKFELAFDHARIVRDAAERVRVDLELSGIATAFVGHDVHARRAPSGVRGRLGRASRRRELPAEPPRGGRLGDPDRAQGPARRDRRQAGGALSRRTDVETRRADPVPATNGETKGNEMRAVVFDRTGLRRSYESRRSSGPRRRTTRSSSRFMRRRSTGRIAGFRGAEPFFSRVFTGLLRPKYRTPGMEFAGEVDAVGAGRHRVRGRRRSLRPEGSARTPSTSVSARVARSRTSPRT